MELVKVGEKTYYIKNPTNVGVYRIDENNVYLIDTGNDKDAGKKILKIIDTQGWNVKGIVSTHSNADHIGGNKLIQDRTGCPVYAYGMEKCFTEYPFMEPSFLFGAFPFKDLKNKFLLAKESVITDINNNLPEGLEYFSLKGHFFDMIGIKTDDDVYFLADSLVSEETIMKYHLFFLYDIREYLKTLDFISNLDGKDNLKLYEYEIYNNVDNANKLKDIISILDTDSKGVPFLIIGNNVIAGYAENITDERIRNTINYYKNHRFKDEVGIYLGVVEDSDEEFDEKVIYQETIDEIGLSSNLKNIVSKSPLFISAMLIGLVDGFNPCAMWILLFLISMLLDVKNKNRKWILGLTFIISSAAIYFVFLMSWLELSVFLNKVGFIRLGISVCAIILGTISLVKFIDSIGKDGCVVVNKNNRKRIITSIKNIIKEKSFILAVLGMMLLACSVNIIELFCSLGLPVVFTQILSLNEVSSGMRVIYSLIYVLFFMIDDLLVFFISMKTLELKAISNKYSKYSSLIGGLLMIIIGFLMIYKPELLMFDF